MLGKLASLEPLDSKVHKVLRDRADLRGNEAKQGPLVSLARPVRRVVLERQDLPDPRDQRDLRASRVMLVVREVPEAQDRPVSQVRRVSRERLVFKARLDCREHRDTLEQLETRATVDRGE